MVDFDQTLAFGFARGSFGLLVAFGDLFIRLASFFAAVGVGVYGSLRSHKLISTRLVGHLSNDS